MSDVRQRLEEVFHEVFDSDIILTEELSAKDVEDWDSLQHINLLIATEKRFGVRFATAEISRLKDPGQNVGSFIRLIEEKLNAGSGRGR